MNLALPLTLDQALSLTYLLAGVSNLIQAAELLSLRPAWRDLDGVWRWSELAPEFEKLPGPARRLAELTLPEQPFFLLQSARILAALLLILQPDSYITTTALWICLFGTLATSVRWRGAFNGGSDAMSLVVLWPLALASLMPWPLTQHLALAYIGVQTLLSYWIAGLVKLAQPSWRQGKALKLFFETPQYNVPSLIRVWIRRPGAAFLLGWGVLLFELLSPLALSSPTATLFFLPAAGFFHLINAAVLGLNRFTWAWLSAYPAVIVLAQWVAARLTSP